MIVASDHEPVPPTPDREQGRPHRVLLQDGWQVQFADREVSVAVDLPHVLESEADRAAYSGSATYRTTVDLGDLGPTARIHLDLGDVGIAAAGSAEAEGLLGHSFRAGIEPPVGVIAEVRVNDVDCGTAWSPPYVVEVSRAALSGTNRVEITVANTAANAVAHDPHLPTRVADSERRYGRRFRMQELYRAMDGIRSGLLATPALVITH